MAEIRKQNRIQINKDGCWIWLLAKMPNGYGIVSVNRKNIMAHRFYYEKYKGLIPDGMQVDHLCRNRACVNPDHLQAVSQQVNIQRGISAKLNNNSILKIREMYRSGKKQMTIASIFNIGQDEVSRIVNNKRWSNVISI